MACGAGRWAAILDAEGEGRFRIAIVNGGSGAVSVAEERTGIRFMAFALAARQGRLFVGHGKTVEALSPGID